MQKLASVSDIPEKVIEIHECFHKRIYFDIYRVILGFIMKKSLFFLLCCVSIICSNPCSIVEDCTKDFRIFLDVHQTVKRKGNYERALEYYSNIFNNSLDSKEKLRALKSMAICQFELGNTTEALSTLEIIKKEDPSFPLCTLENNLLEFPSSN